MKTQLAAIVVAALLGGVGGSIVQQVHDQKIIGQALENELQANGLEDECKAKLPVASFQTMAPTMTYFPNGSWAYEHVPMPKCPDKAMRSVEIPEKDEVDALTVRCEMPK